MFLSLLDAFSVWLLILFYLTGIDLIFLVNVNFVVMLVLLALYGIYTVRIQILASIFIGILAVSVVKIFIGLMPSNNIEANHFLSYALGLLIPIFALSFSASFSAGDAERVKAEFNKFAVKYIWIAFPGIIVYFTFYVSGKIVYFGLGSNLHYVFPFFAEAALIRSTIIFFAIIAISGKRAVLLNFIVQCIPLYARYFKQRPGILAIVSLAFIAAIYFLIQYTMLFSRLELVFNVDLSDQKSLGIALGGRFEELVGIYQYFKQHPNQIWFGAPPGAYYTWAVTFSDYEATKNYSHITIFGYVFRYGFLAALLVYSYFGYLIVKLWSGKNPFFVVFVGILAGSFFGANLVIDPLSWIFIGMLISLHLKERPVIFRFMSRMIYKSSTAS